MKRALIIIAVMTMTFLIVGTVSAATVQPSVDFTTFPDNGTGSVPFTVKFTGSTTGIPSGMFADKDYWWDFGDNSGSIRQSKTVSHTYVKVGVYDVTLVVTNTTDYSGNAMWFKTQKIGCIHVTNTSPTVSVSPSAQEVHLGDRAEFTSDVSDNGVYSYVWTFGDGHSVPPSGNEIIPSTGIIYEHTGTYSVTLTVTNDGGTTTSTPVTVTVIPPIPVADFVGNPQIGMAPLAVKFWDGTDSVMAVNTWAWDFGDGSTATDKNPLHAYADVGLYNVSLSVSNGYDGGAITKLGYINVTAEDPFPDPVCENTTEYINTTEYVYVNTTAPALDNIGVFRPSTGTWYLENSFTGVTYKKLRFGIAEDIPVTGDFNGDGVFDIAVYRPSTSRWYFDTNQNGAVDKTFRFGINGDIPLSGDFNNDGTDGIAVFRSSTGRWYIDNNLDGVVDVQFRYGIDGDVPVTGTWNNLI